MIMENPVKEDDDCPFPESVWQAVYTAFALIFATLCGRMNTVVKEICAEFIIFLLLFAIVCDYAKILVNGLRSKFSFDTNTNTNPKKINLIKVSLRLVVAFSLLTCFVFITEDFHPNRTVTR